MGKRNKEQSVGRRRPMIQLDSARKGVGVVSKNIVEQPATTKTAADDQLAGFLAEINSLDTNIATDASLDASSVATENVHSQSDAQPQGELLYDPNDFDPSTQGHLLPSPWEACYDQNTSYYYYWNKSTNEVQWYPPAVTIPPPPPPPSEEVINSNAKDTDSISAEIDINSTNKEKASTDPNNGEVDSNNKKEIQLEKDRDKELMSQIKERIQKKKEKLKKQKEEQLSKDENDEGKSDSSEQDQKEKEDRLREKLIRKKQEREQALFKENSEESQLEEDISSKSKNNSLKEDDFSVDMFAEENAQDKDEKSIEIETENNVAENNMSATLQLQNNKEITSPVENNSENTEPENMTIVDQSEQQKESKGGWRIVDSMYDDESGESEIETNEPSNTANIKTVDENVPADQSEEKQNNDVVDNYVDKQNIDTIDDYADMLLEDGISEKEAADTPPLPAEEPIAPLPPPADKPPLPPEYDSKPPPPPEDEPALDMPPLSALEEEVERRKEITRLSSELSEKLNFLGISSKSLKSLEVYLVELEIRKKDWQAGALETKYFLDTLNNLSELIGKHEQSAAPTGWMCHWSNDYKMYYYHNSVTGESQWNYPATPSMADYNGVATSMGYHALFQQSLMASYVGQSSMMVTSNPAIVSPAHGFTTEPTTTPQTKKRPATESAKSSNDTSVDPYRSAKRKKEKDTTDEVAHLSGTDSGTSSPLPSKVIASAPLIRTRESSPAVTATPPLPMEDYPDAPSPLPPSQDGQSLISAKPKIKRKKKTETSVKASNLASKKLKHVSSLVQKWQSVKQQAEEEENVELSEDESYEQASERRIEEWKKEIETSGDKDYNPNFTEIKGDWRERLKRKT